MEVADFLLIRSFMPEGYNGNQSILGQQVTMQEREMDVLKE